MSHRLAAASLGVSVLASCLLPTCAVAQSAQIVFADGRREIVEEPRKDAKGRWTAVRDGRRTTLTPGDVVVVVDAAGNETVTIPVLLDNSDPPETAAVLASLRDPKNGAWLQATEELATQPTQTVLEALVALASDRKKDLRHRGIHALARLRTKESVMAAATAILAEKDQTLRRNAASVLFSVQEIFERCDGATVVGAGIEDKDPVVRIVFALLSPDDLEAASALLRTEGLKNRDHHIRESTALELGRRGDGAGESVLIGMLARTRIPGFDGEDALMERHLVSEQVETCGILGRLATKNAKAALQKAASSRFDAVRRAAAAALATLHP